MNDFLYRDHHGLIHNAALLNRLWVMTACAERLYRPSGQYSEEQVSCSHCLKVRPKQDIDPKQLAEAIRKLTHF